MKFELLIRNATVIDGTRAPRYQADIGVLGGKIAAIGKLDAATAQVEIDASDKVASPGFIDSHTHDEGNDQTMQIALGGLGGRKE